MDELSALPYLDRVVRETLRLHAAVPVTDRAAQRDDVIPLSVPIKDRNGREITSVRYISFTGAPESLLNIFAG